MQYINPIHKRWARLWGRFSGPSLSGRIAARLAAIGFPPFHGQVVLARLNPHGFIAPKAMLHHSRLQIGKHVFLGDGVFVYQDIDGGPVTFGESVKLIGNTAIQTGFGGHCRIGARTSIQPYCQFSAYQSPIEVGCDVEIAPYCAFYPYDHNAALGQPISTQPLKSKGGIIIEDEAWLGVRVIVLDGVRIGRGAVVGAGSVVTSDLPENSVCAGTPARVVKMRV